MGTALAPALNSPDDGLQAVNEINPFLLKLLSTVVFYHSIRNLTDRMIKLLHLKFRMIKLLHLRFPVENLQKVLNITTPIQQYAGKPNCLERCPQMTWGKHHTSSLSFVPTHTPDKSSVNPIFPVSQLPK